MNTTAAFAAALGTIESPLTPAALLGLEHEYEVTRDGQPLDFRSLIHDLSIPGLPLDPGDPHAYRCTSGLVLTCDDEGAEVCSPPLPLAPGFTRAIDNWARAGRALLTDAIPTGVEVSGFSTHLSAAMPDDYSDAVADLFVSTFAPALMLVMDRRSSHGVFVRARPSRLELCGEYVSGDRLRATAAFFAGAARACAMAIAIAGTESRHPLPPPLAVQALVAARRPGLEVDRDVAFGFDFYRQGRNARLPLQDGGGITAQEYLQAAWGAASAALGQAADPGDLAVAEHIVNGSAPLGIEDDTVDAILPAAALPPSPFGELLYQRNRGEYFVEPVLATWAFTVFALHGARVGYACVPRAHLSRFLDLLDGGELDAVITTHLRIPASGSVLAGWAQTETPGLWDEVGVPTDLLHPERERASDAGARIRPGKASVVSPRQPASAAVGPVGNTGTAARFDKPLVGASGIAKPGLASASVRVGKPDVPAAARYGKEPVEPVAARAGKPVPNPAAARVGKPGTDMPAAARFDKPSVQPVAARLGKPDIEPTAARVGKPAPEPAVARSGKPDVEPAAARVGKPDLPAAAATTGRIGKPEVPAAAAARADKPLAEPAAARVGKPLLPAARVGKPATTPAAARFGKRDTGTMPAAARFDKAPLEPAAARFDKPAPDLPAAARLDKPDIEPAAARFGKPVSDAGGRFGKPSAMPAAARVGKPAAGMQAAARFGKPGMVEHTRLGKPGTDMPAVARFGKAAVMPAAARFGKPAADLPAAARSGKAPVMPAERFGKGPVEPTAARFGKPASDLPAAARYGKPGAAAARLGKSEVPAARVGKPGIEPDIAPAAAVVGAGAAVIAAGTLAPSLFDGPSPPPAPPPPPSPTSPVTSTEPVAARHGDGDGHGRGRRDHQGGRRGRRWSGRVIAIVVIGLIVLVGTAFAVAGRGGSTKHGRVPTTIPQPSVESTTPEPPTQPQSSVVETTTPRVTSVGRTTVPTSTHVTTRGGGTPTPTTAVAPTTPHSATTTHPATTVPQTTPSTASSRTTLRP